MSVEKGSIHFINESGRFVQLFKGGSEDNLQMVSELAPETESTETTTAGEVWLVKDKETGHPVGKITGTSSEQTYTILRPRGLPEKSGSSGGGD